MKAKDKDQKQNNSLSRRNFLTVAGAGAVGMSSMPLNKLSAKEKPIGKPIPTTPVQIEWRNKVSGMSYRQLGRTGMMISEVVNGGDPVRSDNYKMVDMAIERGVNYLDMAPAYGGGDCEVAYSKVINSSSKRLKVFMTTKVSGFDNVRNAMYQDIFKGLPSEKQNKILERAKEIRAERFVDKPGYFLLYWPGQDRSMDKGYISNAMVKDYGHKVDGSKAYRDMIIKSVEGSLERAKTDHFDILMCPHGGNSREEVSIPEIFSTFQELKQSGKVRFLGVSSHNDPAGVLDTATDMGYDVVMCAYNVINGGYLEASIKKATEAGVGVIAMKVAMAVATHHEAIKPIPQWRIDKIHRIIPGDMKAPMKAYLWALQNPNISAVISNLWNEDFINDNLSIVGKKVDLMPG